MTRKEFEKLRVSIESEKFLADCSDPIDYGIQRAAFESQKFKRLIAAAKQVKMQTARTKQEQWKRQLERATEAQARFEKIRQEIRNLKTGADGNSGETQSASSELATTAT